MTRSTLRDWAFVLTLLSVSGCEKAPGCVDDAVCDVVIRNHGLQPNYVINSVSSERLVFDGEAFDFVDVEFGEQMDCGNGCTSSGFCSIVRVADPTVDYPLDFSFLRAEERLPEFASYCDARTLVCDMPAFALPIVDAPGTVAWAMSREPRTRCTSGILTRYWSASR